MAIAVAKTEAGRAMLNDLIERLKCASEPDRELDAHIDQEVNGWAHSGRAACSNTGEEYTLPSVPPYTSSIDAALTLVPEGLDYVVRSLRDRAEARVGGAKNEYMIKGGQHPVPAIALCIAALKARSALTDREK